MLNTIKNTIKEELIYNSFIQLMSENEEKEVILITIDRRILEGIDPETGEYAERKQDRTTGWHKKSPEDMRPTFLVLDTIQDAIDALFSINPIDLYIRDIQEDVWCKIEQDDSTEESDLDAYLSEMADAYEDIDDDLPF